MRWQQDNRLHLFRGYVGELALALCPLMVPVAELAEPEGEDGVRCTQCLLNWGATLADRRGDRGSQGDVMDIGWAELPADQRLAASITMLATELALVAEELLGGVFDDAERHELADKLVDIAQDVRPGGGS